eukprot:TRINITY_DN3031_c0_g1_i2.p1 TRINITY_DN3031_c0_g1~~TRINITY_DN3031_c0_g1_i2.p1  ORF type:complete len:272 (-),score=73.35 TRINITY_DN3031_c0_g1_i2:389-1204(-)
MRSTVNAAQRLAEDVISVPFGAVLDQTPAGDDCTCNDHELQEVGELISGFLRGATVEEASQLACDLVHLGTLPEHWHANQLLPDSVQPDRVATYALTVLAEGFVDSEIYPSGLVQQHCVPLLEAPCTDEAVRLLGSALTATREPAMLLDALVNCQSTQGQRALAGGLVDLVLFSGRAAEGFEALCEVVSTKQGHVLPATRGCVLCSMVRHWPHKLYEALPTLAAAFEEGQVDLSECGPLEDVLNGLAVRLAPETPAALCVAPGLLLGGVGS